MTKKQAPRATTGARIRALEAVCDNAYAVVGSLLIDLDAVDTPEGTALLDSFIDRAPNDAVFPMPTFTQTEYLLVSDANSKVLHSGPDLEEARRLKLLCEDAGGSVTIFKALKG